MGLKRNNSEDRVGEKMGEEAERNRKQGSKQGSVREVPGATSLRDNP